MVYMIYIYNYIYIRLQSIEGGSCCSNINNEIHIDEYGTTNIFDVTTAHEVFD